jgi:hypothetical protein
MRALPRGLMVLGVIGIAVAGICGGNEDVKEIIAQNRTTREIIPPTTSINKIVIGVLNVETGYTLTGDIRVKKNALMRELKRNTRVKLFDIDESCSLSDLKRHGYKKAEKYKMDYQLDMILHTYYTGMPSSPRKSIYFNLIDLYTKRAKEVSIEADSTLVEFALRGISRKLLVSQDLNRVLRAKKEGLAEKEVTVSAEAKDIPKRETKEIAAPVNKVVVGVLDFEASGVVVGSAEERKKLLMKDLRRNTRVKLVDIRESCSLSDLKRHGYEEARRYKDIYQLDMILHVYSIEYGSGSTYAGFRSHLSLIDLYTEKVKKISIDARGIAVELAFKGISKKLLINKDLSRVLREKKKALGEKEVAVAPEVKEIPKREVMGGPQEIEDFLIQKGPKLIAEGEYDRVLELIDDLPRRRSRHFQIQTLECFANLKGWVSDRDQSCKSRWWNVRERLINSGDNEATPMLLIFLKDEDPWMRIYAAELLGHIGDKRALKDLRAAGENDENRKVRKYAKKAYEQIFGEKF